MLILEKRVVEGVRDWLEGQKKLKAEWKEYT